MKALAWVLVIIFPLMGIAKGKNLEFLTSKEFLSLSYKYKVQYVRTMQKNVRILSEMQKGFPVGYASNQLDFSNPIFDFLGSTKAYAAPGFSLQNRFFRSGVDGSSQVNRCIYAGHLSTYREKAGKDGRRYCSSKQVQGTCKKHQVQCNFLVYGHSTCLSTWADKVNATTVCDKQAKDKVSANSSSVDATVAKAKKAFENNEEVRKLASNKTLVKDLIDHAYDPRVMAYLTELTIKSPNLVEKHVELKNILDNFPDLALKGSEDAKTGIDGYMNTMKQYCDLSFPNKTSDKKGFEALKLTKSQTKKYNKILKDEKRAPKVRELIQVHECGVLEARFKVLEDELKVVRAGIREETLACSPARFNFSPAGFTCLGCKLEQAAESIKGEITAQHKKQIIPGIARANQDILANGVSQKWLGLLHYVSQKCQSRNGGWERDNKSRVMDAQKLIETYGYCGAGSYNYTDGEKKLNQHQVTNLINGNLNPEESKKVLKEVFGHEKPEQFFCDEGIDKSSNINFYLNENKINNSKASSGLKTCMNDAKAVLRYQNENDFCYTDDDSDEMQEMIADHKHGPAIMFKEGGSNKNEMCYIASEIPNSRHDSAKFLHHSPLWGRIQSSPEADSFDVEKPAKYKANEFKVLRNKTCRSISDYVRVDKKKQTK